MDDSTAFKLLIDQVNGMVGFFKRRVEVEEAYCEQLAKMLSKQEEVEVLMDAEGLRLIPSSVRQAWKEVVNSLKNRFSSFLYCRHTKEGH
ncbi:hypothetical protein BT69DRAFT_640399 [Atractiella rhizophila]|nr:hypothetical protein BT69DRAFT_640399 [Atractiella rhizophila]